MKFGTAKNTVLGVLLSALVIAAAGMIMLTEGTPEYVASEIVALVLLAAGIAIAVIWGRCPYCGQRLFSQLLKYKTCPRCRRALDPNGKYVLSKKAGR